MNKKIIQKLIEEIKKDDSVFLQIDYVDLSGADARGVSDILRLQERSDMHMTFLFMDTHCIDINRIKDAKIIKKPTSPIMNFKIPEEI